MHIFALFGTEISLIIKDIKDINYFDFYFLNWKSRFAKQFVKL